jgi:hypothetical protein
MADREYDLCGVKQFTFHLSASSLSSIKLLTRLNIPQDNWLKLTTEFGKLFHGPVGTLQELTRYCEHLRNGDDTSPVAASI